MFKIDFASLNPEICQKDDASEQVVETIFNVNKILFSTP